MGMPKKHYIRMWAAAQLRTYDTDEIIRRLSRFRTFYVMAWEDCLERGEINEAGPFYTMIDRITRLFHDIEIEKSSASIAVAQTVMRYPLMLAPMENLEFSHLLDDKKDVTTH